MLTVDGGWSDLGEWSVCSAECGGGSQIRSKTCTNPSPTNGGKECEGEDEELRTCNPDPCPGLSKYFLCNHPCFKVVGVVDGSILDAHTDYEVMRTF